MKTNNYHESVLTDTVIKFLDLARFAHLKGRPRVIDATLGTGGHTEAVLKEGATVLGIDLDPAMLKIAGGRLKNFKGRFRLTQGNFRNVEAIAKKEGFSRVEGVIFDLGISNIHFKGDPRGFSFADPAAVLDMRLDRINQAVAAKDLLNALRPEQLEKVFSQTLERGNAREIARRVVRQRGNKAFEKVGDFLDILGGIQERKLHPGTRAFLALRMAVNSELTNLEEALPKAFGLLSPKGRLLVISFHSGEDGVVKDFFKKAPFGKILTPKPLLPSWEEIAQNPRARSARLRVLEKI
jgi:16S rRNA (cytosine1402-N4)-methyltransferase